MSSVRPLAMNTDDPAYAADKAALGCGIPFSSQEEMLDYTSNLLGTRWWKKRHPRFAWVEIEITRRQAYAYAIGRHLYFPPEAMHECYLLHELAHAVSPEEEEGHHGPIWRRNYADLVQYKMGKPAADCLRRWFEYFEIPI